MSLFPPGPPHGRIFCDEMTMSACVIIAMGEVLWDKLPSGDQLGGAPANFVCHARALGADARLVSRVGLDDDGRRLIQTYTDRGESSEFIQFDEIHPTGRVQVALSDGHPTYTIEDPSAWDFIEMNEQLTRVATRAEAVCFSTLSQRHKKSRESIQRFVCACSEGTLRFFDLNLRQHFYSLEIVQFGLEAADVLKINNEENDALARMFGWRSEDTIRQLFERFPLKLVALTKGADGSELHTRERIVRELAPGTELADAVGAGDAFSAALICSLLQGKALEETARFANLVGSFVASQPGATPQLPPDLTGRREMATSAP